jgi:NAD(P)-dependent dehydrogenase (short-subunit alcohol dehydrogenase family)
MDFQGVALVTGAASGIGRATALLYAAEGCKRIVIADFNVALLQEAKKQIEQVNQGAEVLALAVDVRSDAAVEDMVHRAVEAFGRIDYCANVAGILRFGDTSVLPLSDFEDVYQVNLRGTFLCAKAEINAMLRQEPLKSSHSKFAARGAIVNVSSQAGLMGNGNLPAYVASKHGVVGLSKSDGVKFAQHGIRVNAVCPGTIETPILGALPQGEIGERRAVERTREIAMGRVGRPEEVAQCIIFLTSGRSSFVTGTTLAVHGGLHNT